VHPPKASEPLCKLVATAQLLLQQVTNVLLDLAKCTAVAAALLPGAAAMLMQVLGPALLKAEGGLS